MSTPTIPAAALAATLTAAAHAAAAVAAAAAAAAVAAAVAATARSRRRSRSRDMFSWLFVEKTDVSADDGPRDLAKPDPALFERANWRPADEASSPVQRSVQLSAPGSSGRGAGSSSGSCLFDRYGGGTVRTASRLEGIGANGTTLSARLRTSGILRLMCYVNTDDRGSPAAFVPVGEHVKQAWIHTVRPWPHRDAA